MIVYSKQSISLRDAIRVGLQVKNRSLTQGLEINKFEESVASYVGAKYAVAVSSATAGLHLAHLVVGNPIGSQVATSPFSFVASANSIIYANQVPFFVDIDSETGNISVEQLLKILDKEKIKTVVPVHYSGVPCDMERISEICRAKNIQIIEDAAHALGATYPTGKKVGSCAYSDLTVFSFHPVKSITTGEGGMITTNNLQYYKALLKLRSHGIHKNELEFENEMFSYTGGKPNTWYYEMELLGYHYRLTEIQAVLGSSQLKKIERFMSKRKKIAKFYDTQILKIENIQGMNSSQRDLSANHLYPIKINFAKISKSRNQIMSELKDLGIITQVHYIPIPVHPFYKKLGYQFTKVPNAMNLYYQILSIPIHPELSIRDQKKVLKSLKKIIA